MAEFYMTDVPYIHILHEMSNSLCGDRSGSPQIYMHGLSTIIIYTSHAVTLISTSKCDKTGWNESCSSSFN